MVTPAKDKIAEGKERSSSSVACCKSRPNINKETLPLKVTLFLFCGAMAAILPYLTIHMQVLGITIQETASIYAILPFTSFLGPPLMGFLADKLGQYKPVLIIATISNGLFHTLLLTVPIYRESPVSMPITFKLDHVSSQGILVPESTLSETCDTFNSFMHKRQNEDIKDFIINSCSILVPDGDYVLKTFTNGSEWGSISKRCKIKDDGRSIQFLCSNPLENELTESNSSSSHDSLSQYQLNRVSLSKSLNSNCSHSISVEGLTFSSDMDLECLTNMSFPTGKVTVIGNNAVTFWTYFIFRIVATLFMSSCFSLLDATTLAMVKEAEKSEYGKERIWSVIGFGTISPIAGLLVDIISRKKGYTDYSSAFYLSNCLLVVNVAVYFLMNLKVEKPEKGVMKDVRKLLQYPEVVIFLIMMFILGNLLGFVESFLFIFLKELHAPNYLLGLTLTVGSLAGIPFSYLSEKILKRISRINIIIIAFLTYFVRFFGYSYITSPFWCFPFEAMEALTYHLMWIAAATYCSVLAPKGLLATLVGLMGSLHYSLGKGSGSFIGGHMMGIIGTRLSFRYFGIAAGVFGIIYFLINLIWLDAAVTRRKEKESAELAEAEEKNVDQLEPFIKPSDSQLPNI